MFECVAILLRHGKSSENIETEYLTDVISGLSVDFITRSVNDGVPFFAYVSTSAPHSPAIPAARHADMFPEITGAPQSPSYNEADVSDKPLWVRNIKSMSSAVITANDSLYKKRLQSLQAVDEMVANIVTTLTNLGALDNTYIIFTSDHGLLLGEHRLSDTKGAAYEEVIHVPYVVRGPGVVPGSAPTRYILNIDTAPSLLVLAGVSAWSAPLDGIAIDFAAPGNAQPVTTRGDDPNRFLIEQMVDLTSTPVFIPAFNALRTSRYTYIEYNTTEKEHYDNSKDPYQQRSIPNTSSPAQSQLSIWINSLVTCKGASCRTGR